jgi:hypothetical protein
MAVIELAIRDRRCLLRPAETAGLQHPVFDAVAGFGGGLSAANQNVRVKLITPDTSHSQSIT